MRNALWIEERSIFRSTPADLRRGETDSMFIFREDLGEKKKKKKMVSCANSATLAAATLQRQERKRGVSRHHAEQGTHDKPMSASRRNEKRQEEVLNLKERARSPRGSPNLSAHLHSRRTTDGRHEPEKKKPPESNLSSSQLKFSPFPPPLFFFFFLAESESPGWQRAALPR